MTYTTEEITQYYYDSMKRDDRGLSPRDVKPKAHRDALSSAVKAGYITAPRGSWGYRMTEKGRELIRDLDAKEAAHYAKLTAAGFDPNKKVADMTPEEIKAFVAWNDR